ncbi:hypothetical protein [Mycoplasmopsis primatum]|uniref:hypothetical protein n=1 Tax=Mycoplasmopsis primatum TaxID=55604 RepID=UPI0004969050|nr:hypothetical protein [Mycoplasmopsis primatum]
MNWKQMSKDDLKEFSKFAQSNKSTSIPVSKLANTFIKEISSEYHVYYEKEINGVNFIKALMHKVAKNSVDEDNMFDYLKKRQVWDLGDAINDVKARTIQEFFSYYIYQEIYDITRDYDRYQRKLKQPIE